MAVLYTTTRQLRAVMHSREIDETTKMRLQNIQDCQNMMKSGRWKDILKRTTQATSSRSI
jgi:hypothetical protein